MIYITGDCHGDFERFNKSIFPEQEEMNKGDFCIICGDFGGVWNKDKESAGERWWMDWLEDKPFTTLFVDGNHENFDRLYAYPVEEWRGGKVHRIRPSVIHLMRGQVFTIDRRKIFTFGGAASHDYDRINHISWWERELPTEEEMEEGRRNLEANGNQVDFIVTHCCASSAQTVLSHGMFQPDVLTDYLEEIRRKVVFKKWFFGHYHDNKNVNAEEIVLYEQMVRIL